MQIRVAGQAIQTVEDWFRLAPPRGRERQWKDGYSAKELARAWCPPSGVCVPSGLVNLLASNATLGAVLLEEAEPEVRVAIDDLPGEPRNADLVALGRAGDTRVAVSVEAKAAEPFGDYVKDVLRRADALIAEGDRTNVPQRVQALSQA